MIGGGKKDKKFLSFIIKQINEGRKTFNIVNDTFGNPTYTKFFAQNLYALINTKLYGKYHMACTGNTSRVEITKYFLKTLNMKESVINEVSSEFFKKEFFVNRPKYEILSNSNLENHDLNLMDGWKEAIYDYVHTSWKDMIVQG